MDRILAFLLAAALGGAGGGFLVHALAPPAASDVGVAGAGRLAADNALADQLAGIEQRLDALGATRGLGPGLRPGAAPREGTPPPANVQLDDATIEALAARLDERMKSTVKDAVAEAGAEGGETRSRRRPERKRVALADAARELELSTSQEEALRELYAGMEEKVYAMLAGEDGDPEEVRRDVAMVKADRSKTFEVVGKYMPKALGNLGGFMALDNERRQRTREIVGPDKARRLERDFSIEEQDPIGMGGGFQFEAGN